MKMKRTFLTCSLVALGVWLQAQAGPLTGCFDIQPPGTWSEVMLGGLPGQVGNEIEALGPNFSFQDAKLASVTADTTQEWDWLTKYEGAKLSLANVAGAPWYSKCEGNDVVFEVLFPEVWVKTRSDRYAATNAGYIEFMLTATNGAYSLRATYAGTPAYTPEVTATTSNLVASAALSTASVCIGQAVKVDVIPRPFNLKSKGVLPVAIYGSRQFDVNTIDPSTIKIECAPALRWVYAKGRGGKLLLKFDRQAIVENLPLVENRDMVPLTLTATLKDGTPVSGSDKVMIIKPKTKPAKPAKPVKPEKPGKK
jgi:hypothetical protein